MIRSRVIIIFTVDFEIGGDVHRSPRTEIQRSKKTGDDRSLRTGGGSQGPALSLVHIRLSPPTYIISIYDQIRSSPSLNSTSSSVSTDNQDYFTALLLSPLSHIIILS